MTIKPTGCANYSINPFYLYGFTETGLTKAFAFTLSRSPDLLFRFLRLCGIEKKKSLESFKQINIEIERVRDEGRTDIEIFLVDDFHLIVEAKVAGNKIGAQRVQYLGSFKSVPQKALCILTQTNDYKKLTEQDVKVTNVGWIDIDRLIDDPHLLGNPVVGDFQTYLRRGYKLRDQKEILVQDLSDSKEMKKFRDHRIYRRGTIFGSPLYFAPHFTRTAAQPEGEGISFLSKVMGIISCKPSEVATFREDLLEFAEGDINVVDQWLQGCSLDTEEEVFTYFFLAEPTKLKKPLLKDGGKMVGRGKNWIAAQIPPNRCVTFEEFVKHM